MVHWAFLIPAFIVDFTVGYFLYQIDRVVARLNEGLEEAIKNVRL